VGRVKDILQELMKEMEISENIRLKIVPMKKKIASLSLATNVLRFNRNVVKFLNDEEIRYILIHELIHLKIRDVNHGSLFLRELSKYYNPRETYHLEIEIIRKLSKLTS
jgi:predicted metal-dependent hydrolase